MIAGLHYLWCGGWFIRKARYSDFYPLLRIDLLSQELNDCTPATSAFPWTEDELDFILKSEEQHLWVACLGNSPVGFVLFTRESGYIFVEKIAVHPKHQYRGVGTALMERLAREIDPDHSHIEVWVRERNVRALKFFSETVPRSLRLSSCVLSVIPDSYQDTQDSSVVFRVDDWEENYVGHHYSWY